MERDYSSGERLREARESIAHMTITQAAEATGIHRTDIGRFENAERPLNKVAHLRKLSEAYGVTADYLLGCTDYPFPDKEETGLTTDALANLAQILDILIKPATEKAILSDILKSEHFGELVLTLRDLMLLAEDINDYVSVSRSQGLTVEEGSMIYDPTLESQMSALKYGRYAVLESCNALLDEIVGTPVDEVIREANDYLHGR